MRRPLKIRGWSEIAFQKIAIHRTYGQTRAWTPSAGKGRKEDSVMEGSW